MTAKITRAILALVIFVAACGSGRAQNYPTRAVTIIVPFAAGGAFDVIARILAVGMTKTLGQQIIVENTTGAAGIIGVTRVINAAPDGYTILFGSIGTHAYNQTMYKRPRYQAAADFTPLALVAEQPMVLTVRKDLAAGTMQEFVAYTKANQAKMQYGSAGVGSTTHLACSLLNTTIGANVTHVPYRGGGPAANDLVGGQIDYICLNLGGAVPLIAGKQVKAIALLSRDRSALLPELATAHEQGLTDFDVVTWNALFLPRGAPAAIVKRLNEATSVAMDDSLIKKRLHDIGVTAVAAERRTPEYLSKFVVDEIARWEGPIKNSGLQVD
jgi:tripartite-type tricarboxylate transporter receptor subunit TctC